ncbi:polyphenol oxidase family protein [bacterium]|nr:polyphenol oxidase family protein [bacterium]
MTSFQNNLGFGFKSDEYLIFFGNARASLEDLQNKFSQYAFKRVKQTHSDFIVESSDAIPEADAHYTAELDHALVIATADCMPIMIYCLQTSRVMAIHAGWRGVENKITEKSLNQLIATGSTDKNFKIFIGPHILQSSFEVEADTYDLLAKAHYGLKPSHFMYSRNNKFYINLDKIVISQIEHVIQKLPEIEILSIDTKTDREYHSHRRDQTKQRNFSFVVRI